MPQQIGLFFGSFNPIHTGHLIIANAIVENTSLEEVWFVLSPHNPLKDSTTLLDYHARLKMLEMAIQDNPHFYSCTVEFDLPKPSYTIHTLDFLSKNHSGKHFSLIIGSDNLEEIEKWKEYQSILDNYIIYVYPRPNFSGSVYAHHKNVNFILSPLLEISSTYIRESVKQHKSIKYLVPEAVLQYIEEANLYKDKF